MTPAEAPEKPLPEPARDLTGYASAKTLEALLETLPPNQAFSSLKQRLLALRY